MSGAEPQNRSSGFQVTARAGMARLRLKGAAGAIAEGIVNMNVIAAKILENVIREPVTVFAQTPRGVIDQRVHPRDVAGQYYSHVSLEAASPQDRVERGLFGKQLKEAGLASELMVRRDYLGQTNALEDMMQTKAEMIMSSPEYMLLLAQLAGMITQQAEQIATSEGIVNRGNQYGAGANASFDTTSQPNQNQRVQDRLKAILPGGMQDIQNRMAQFGMAGAGPLNTTMGQTIPPGG